MYVKDAVMMLEEDEELVYEIELDEGGAFKGDQSATGSDYKGDLQKELRQRDYHGKTEENHLWWINKSRMII